MRWNKIVSVLTCILFFTQSFALNVSAAENVIVSGSKSAKVIEIIDGDAIKVQLIENGDTALVKLIGVDAQGYSKAVEFLTNTILGQTVIISSDYNVATPTGIWNNMYVAVNGININEALIEKGYAIANKYHNQSGEYSSLLNAERTAKSKDLGIWNYGVRETTGSNSYGITTYTPGKSYKTGYNVNINTASASMLQQYLNNVPSGVASNIVAYREKNPFNTVMEIKFVEGFTREMFLENQNIMVVCTNIQDAEEKELFTLGTITEDEVDDIISYRKRHGISQIVTLKDEKLVSENRYKKIKDFISTRDKDKLDDNVTENEYTVNINTANTSMMTTAGLSSAAARKIYDNRKNGYTYKTLMELSKGDIGLSVTEVNRFEDNMKVQTDINNASDYEMKSVFGDSYKKIIAKRTYVSPQDVREYIDDGKYENIKKCIYTSSPKNDYVNINTATQQQLIEAGFNTSDAVKLVNSKKTMKTGADIPIDISYNNVNAALYTNINTATVKELESLNNGISSGLISEILSYRQEQFFGNNDEIKQFFTDRNAYSVYVGIGDFLVVR